MTTLYTNFIGIDIGKAELVMNIHGSKTTYVYSNNFEGAEKLWQEQGPSFEKALIVLEVTGGYERFLIRFLQEKKVAVHRANGRQVKSFIRSHGILAKNDQIDAKALALYGFERQARLDLYQPNAYDSLRCLNERRSDLVAMRRQEKNRLAAPKEGEIHASYKAVLDVLDAQIAVLDVEIKTMITSDAELTLKTTVLKTLPGIADVTACALLAHMPEIGTLTTKEVASLAGVAPHPNQSGMKNGYRRTRGGRKQMRPVLFMAALSAAQSKSTLGVFYQRLLQNGKAKMCALVAVMRKMIVIANARIKEALAQYKNEQEKIMISA